MMRRFSTAVKQASLSLGCMKTHDYWQGNTKFGFNLLDRLSKHSNSQENIFISPFSISSAFSLAYAGAPQNTATHDEIANVLYYPQNVNEVDLTKQVLKEQRDLTDGSSKKVNVSVANRIFYTDQSKLHDQIINVIGSDNYQPLDFSQEAEALKIINKWIEDNTDGEIKHMVSSLSSKAFAVIINAIVIDAKWAKHFEKNDTKLNQSFYTDATKKTKLHNNVSLMKMEQSIYDLKYFDSNCFEFLKMPFAKDENTQQTNHYYLLIALPKCCDKGLNNDGGDSKLTLQDFDQAVNVLSENNVDEYSAYVQSLGTKLSDSEAINLKIKLSLPKMKINYGTGNLIRDLNHLGMIEPFLPDKAQFTNLRDPAHIASRNIFINSVIHETMFEMKEEGVKAAAATAITMCFRESCMTSPPVHYIPFTVNHPFYVAVMAEDTNVNVQKLLFLGHIKQVI